MSNTDNIPQALRDCKGWLVWKFIQTDQNKKPLKIPHYAGTREWRKCHAHGSREDRQQLVDFDKAVEVLGKGRKFNGLGLAMLSDWGMIAADFDDCVDESGNVHPTVAALVAPTYWEFSPSKQGIRAFFTGSMRDAKLITKRAKEAGLDFGIEVFNSKGFVTVTGDVSPEVELIGNEIVPITEEFRKFFDEYFGSRNVSTINNTQPVVGATDDELREILKHWDATCDYDTWLNVGMAIHHETDGAGFELWHDWSSTGANYESFEECQYKWESFGRGSKKSVKTLRWMLHEKPIDICFENVGNDFTPLPKKKDSKGNIIRPAPSFFGINNNGEIPPSAQNVKAAVERPDILGWEYRRDNFKHRVMLQPYGEDNAWRDIEDDDYFDVQVCLDKMMFKNPPMDKVRNAVHNVARDNQFHSAQLWLNEVVPAWDGVNRLKDYAKKFLGCTDSEDYAQAVSFYAWTAHAGRVLEPGCKADMMPVLIGNQRVGKSSNVRAISPETAFFTELSLQDDAKVNIEKTMGKLVVEVAEMDGISRRDSNALKSYITRQEENMRLPYGRNATQIPRTFILWGTTNDDQFLTDPTGNRRYLPMHVKGSGSLRFTDKDREQHWAEARELFKKHGIMCVDEANELAEPYRKRAMVSDPWQDIIERGLAEQPSPEGAKYGELEFITSQDIWRDLLGLNDSAMTSAMSRRMAAVMKAVGYVPHKGTKGIRGWRKADGSVDAVEELI